MRIVETHHRQCNKIARAILRLAPMLTTEICAEGLGE
jgi:hypothetical protein